MQASRPKAKLATLPPSRWRRGQRAKSSPPPLAGGGGGGGPAPTTIATSAQTASPSCCRTLSRPFDYRVPPGLHPNPATSSWFPSTAARRSASSGTTASDDGVPDRKLKPLSGVIDTPPMRPALRQFVDWVASYTLSPPGEVMAMALRVVAPGITPPATGWQRAAEPPQDARITEARQKVLAALAEARAPPHRRPRRAPPASAPA